MYSPTTFSSGQHERMNSTCDSMNAPSSPHCVSARTACFFQQFAMRGAKTVYCASAMVSEWIPADRANEDWLVAPHAEDRRGHCGSRATNQTEPANQARPCCQGKSSGWTIGLVKYLAFGFADPITRTRARRGMAYGRGLFKGL